MDARPVKLPKNRTIAPPPLDKRIYPDDADTVKYPGRFLAYRDKDWPKRKYAGIWDDVYSNRDNGHSYIKAGWSGEGGNFVKIKDSIIHLKGGNLHALGVNFTSQSTTGMGHDIANDEKRMTMLEKFFYFTNILMSGPAHISYMDRTIRGSTDHYQALVPIYYNAIGSSGSETMALTKMVIAGGYLPRELKPLLKLNGLYTSAILYLWKAALPYKAPYDHELRHRPAYNSKGDHSDYKGGNQTEVDQFYHNYDDTAHMRNMVNLAKRMTVAPPIALLKTIEVTGGRTVYSLKTTLLVQQRQFKTVRLRVSTEESFDLQGLPLTFRWKVLYGNKNTRIRREGDSSVYTITVPFNAKLPKGRTSILLIANNGKFDGNPAVINVYRAGGAENLRPSLSGLKDETILPGETVRFDLVSIDPEGFPVTFYQWAGEVGSLDGNTFTWKCPAGHPDGAEHVTIIASDGTAGNSHNSRQIKIHVSSTVAVISSDKSFGRAPFTVRFSSRGSRDKKGGKLSFSWDFDDGRTSNEQNPVHTFERPGFYEVVLKVKGVSGTHQSKLVVHAGHKWPLALSGGWDSKSVWQKQPGSSQVKSKGSVLRIFSKEQKQAFSLTSVQDFEPPLYLETVYFRSLDGSKNGTGFQVLGAQIGLPNDPQASKREISIGCPVKNGKSKWATLTIGRKVRFPWCRTRLRVFVDKDPYNKGRIRYVGYLENENGSHFFKLDNQTLVDNKLAVLSANLKSRFDIYRFQVWRPKQGAKGFGAGLNPMVRRDKAKVCSCDPNETHINLVMPGSRVYLKKINIEGNGLNIPNGAAGPNLTDHTDFGKAAAAGGGVVRTFTIQNLGANALKLTGLRPYVALTGANAKAFSVVKAPKPIISRHGSTVFSIKYQPKAKGLHKAKVTILYKAKGKNRYVFHVGGRGF